VDLVLHGGRFITLGPAPGVAEAIGVAGGRIAYVGDAAGARAAAHARTRFVDIGGHTAVPGLIDGHTHVTGIGERMQRIQLEGLRSVAEVLAAVRERAGRSAPGEWVLGNGEYDLFAADRLAEGRLPTRDELDAAAPAHPVYLPVGDDAALVNSRALDAAGLRDATPDPPGGTLHRDAGGRLTGLLAGRTAYSFVRRRIPPPTAGQRRHIIEDMLGRFAALGVTSVVDCGLAGQFADDWSAYRHWRAAGRPGPRVALMVRLDTDGPVAGAMRQIDDAPEAFGSGDEWLRVGPVKLILDGEIETAWMREPYPDRPGYTGLRYLDMAAFREIVAHAVDRGWPVAVHTLGGAAIDAALAVFEEVRRAGAPPLRHSLMHAFFPTAANLAACRRLGLVLSVQPLLFYVYGAAMIRAWGLGTAGRANPLRDVLAAGAACGGGTDVIPYDPMLSIWSAVTRRIRTGDVLGAAQALAPRQALWLHTLGAAAITGEEHLKGSLEVGKAADVTVLSHDILTGPAEAIRHARALMTIVGGVVVHDRLGATPAA
jgi:predicted amidohydrolase YtcJ